MLNKDYTAKLLNLEDAIITNVENICDEVHVYLELPRMKHRCPACGGLTDRVHDYRMQIIKDVPLGRTTLLHLRKRRYRCDCGKRFFEKNTFLPRYYRSTSRLVAKIITAFRETVSAAKIGAQFHVSGATAMRYFKYVSFKPTKLPEVLSIDEFKGNSGGQKYNSIVVDAEKRKMKPMEKLSEEETDKLALMFEIAPRLADAYRLKNEFLKVIRSDSSKTGKPKLVDWLTAVEVMDLPEFDDCIKAYHNWFQEILNSMDVPWSNGFIEGCNNKTKVLKRVCFGMRNFSNFRKRILSCHT